MPLLKREKLQEGRVLARLKIKKKEKRVDCVFGLMSTHHKEC
jgi:hypothetical protein